MRVLVIAEAANPEWTSVPLVGWSLARALADVADVHVVTHVRNRKAIERTGWIEGEQFTAIDSEKVAARLYRLSAMLRGGNGRGWTINTALSSLSYLYFERVVWRTFRDRLTAGEVNLVHRVTPLSPTVPSPIAKKLQRLGVPFVIGPLNGGLPWPKAFDGARRAEFEWLSYVRGGHRLLPAYRATRRHASAILIASRATWQQMPARYRHKCVYLPENAVDPGRFTAVRSRRAARPIRAIFVGRLVPYKGPDMLLEAAAPLLARGDLTLEIVGDGPLRESLEAFVSGQALESAVTFRGWVEHDQVQHYLAEADVLTFPSIREFGGGVVLEAMAIGVPALVVDYGGPAELVTPETGFLVPLRSRDEIITSLRDELERIIADPKLIESRSPPARERVHREFTWQAKARRVIEVYDWVLGRAPKPASASPQHGAFPATDIVHAGTT